MPSTVVSAFSFDETTKRLRVEFVSGLVYEYMDVPKEVFNLMQRATSKGAFLNTHIKGKFKFKRIA